MNYLKRHDNLRGESLKDSAFCGDISIDHSPFLVERYDSEVFTHTFLLSDHGQIFHLLAPQAMPGDDSDILVIGKVASDGSGGSLWYQSRPSIWHKVDVGSNGTVSDQIAADPPPPEVYDDPTTTTDALKIKISDAANMPDAVKAAANILRGLQRFENALSNFADQDRPVIINGQQTSARELLNRLRSTEIEITDTLFENGGVGGALRGLGENGNDKVQFHFDSFDGDGPEDYTHPNYTSDQGIIGIIGHELGHLSDAGDTFHTNSHALYLEESQAKGSSIDYDQTTYWSNNEAFAHSYSKGIAEFFGLNITGWIPNEGFLWKDPHVVFHENMFP